MNLITFFRYLEMEQLDWQNKITEPIKGMLVTHPGMHPGAMRVDQLDREQDDKNVIKYPEIVAKMNNFWVFDDIFVVLLAIQLVNSHSPQVHTRVGYQHSFDWLSDLVLPIQLLYF